MFPLAPIQNWLAPPNQDFLLYNYTFNLLNISSLDAILYPLNIFFDGEHTCLFHPLSLDFLAISISSAPILSNQALVSLASMSFNGHSLLLS